MNYTLKAFLFYSMFAKITIQLNKDAIRIPFLYDTNNISQCITYLIKYMKIIRAFYQTKMPFRNIVKSSI